MAAAGTKSAQESLDLIPGLVRDIERHSSFIKALRVTGHYLSFIDNLKKRRDNIDMQSGDLTLEKFSGAKRLLLKESQFSHHAKEMKTLEKGKALHHSSSVYNLSPFLVQDGLLRVEGKLQFAGFPQSAQHPVIVPHGHLATLLAHQIHSRKNHAGVGSMLAELRSE